MEKITLEGFQGYFIQENNTWVHCVGETIKFKPIDQALRMLQNNVSELRYKVYIEPDHGGFTGGMPYVVYDSTKSFQWHHQAEVARYKTLKGATKKANQLNGLGK